MSTPEPPKVAERTVLVVEDDPSISLGLRINLEAEGYRVLCAEDGERALELAQTIPPDLVLLDVMLPKMNGLEVLRELRRAHGMMPVVILSAKSGEMDKVAGLELGAEDYVSKPFSLAELLARIKAHLRRSAAQAPPLVPPSQLPPSSTVSFGDVVIDTAARSVKKAGRPVEMTATEFDLLAFLVESRGRVVTRDAIFARVWGPNHHGTPRTIDNFMQQLRSKLEDDPRQPVYFQTVRGVGYRFDG